MIKSKTLKSKREFNFVYKNSIKHRNEFYDLYILKHTMTSKFYTKFKNYDEHIVFGLSVSKKIGKAVDRNLIKRRLRHICEEIRNILSKKYTILIIVARGGIKDTPFINLKNSILNTVLK